MAYRRCTVGAASTRSATGLVRIQGRPPSRRLGPVAPGPRPPGQCEAHGRPAGSPAGGVPPPARRAALGARRARRPGRMSRMAPPSAAAPARTPDGGATPSKTQAARPSRSAASTALRVGGGVAGGVTGRASEGLEGGAVARVAVGVAEQRSTFGRAAGPSARRRGRRGAHGRRRATARSRAGSPGEREDGAARASKGSVRRRGRRASQADGGVDLAEGGVVGEDLEPPPRAPRPPYRRTAGHAGVERVAPRTRLRRRAVRLRARGLASCSATSSGSVEHPRSANVAKRVEASVPSTTKDAVVPPLLPGARWCCGPSSIDIELGAPRPSPRGYDLLRRLPPAVAARRVERARRPGARPRRGGASSRRPRWPCTGQGGAEGEASRGRGTASAAKRSGPIPRASPEGQPRDAKGGGGQRGRGCSAAAPDPRALQGA